jgi:hypothetical protein
MTVRHPHRRNSAADPARKWTEAECPFCDRNDLTKGQIVAIFMAATLALVLFGMFA